MTEKSELAHPLWFPLANDPFMGYALCQVTGFTEIILSENADE